MKPLPTKDNKSDKSQPLDEFSRDIVNRLEQSLDQLDPEIQQQLDMARRKAQQPASRYWQPALAAMIGLLLLFPLWQVWQQHWTSVTSPVVSVPPPVLEMEQSYLTVEPQLLADWEMLEVIGEIPDA